MSGEDLERLGRLEARGGNAQHAAEAYHRALKAGHDRPEEVLLRLGNLRAGPLQDHEGAESAYRDALRRKPDFLPALINLGNLHEDAGARDAAEVAYGQALDIRPEDALALARLAGLARDADAASQLAAKLRQALQKADDPADRADLAFGLGRYLDRAASYDEAFGWFEEGNRALEASFGSGFRPYQPEGFDRLVKGLCRPLPRDEATDRRRGEGLIFICGAYRSGSTLLEQILGGSPDVSNGGELRLLPKVMREAGLKIDDAFAEGNDEAFAAAAAAYLEAIQPIRKQAVVFTDKQPDNILLLPAVLRLFPAAKIIITERDPRDCGLSLFQTPLGPKMAYALRLETIGRHLSTLRNLSDYWQTEESARVRSLVYEDLVGRPEETLRPLCEWAGLPFRSEMLAFHRRKNAVQTASVWQVRQSLYGTSSGRWRNYEKHLGPLLATLAHP